MGMREWVYIAITVAVACGIILLVFGVAR
jgi:hypothetical protein